MATLLTDEIKTSLAECALVLGDPVVRRMALERGFYLLCDPMSETHYKLDCQGVCALSTISNKALAFDTEFHNAFKNQSLSKSDKQILDDAEKQAFETLAMLIMSPSYALIASDTINGYDGFEDSYYRYSRINADEQIISDKVRWCLDELEHTILCHLKKPNNKASNRKPTKE